MTLKNKPDNNRTMFSSLVISQVTSTLIDNIIRTAAMLMSLSLGSNGAFIATGAFVLPYILFSPFAGELGDRFVKSRLLFAFKSLEILMIIFLILSIYLKSTYLILIVTFFSGIQSSFISPVRLGIIPQLARNNILRLSSIMDGTMFIAVLAGTAIGLILPIANISGLHHSLAILSIILFLSYCIGFFYTFIIMKHDTTKIVNPEPLTFSWIKTVTKMCNSVSQCQRWRYIWAISAFWGIASILIAEAEPLSITLGLSPASIRFFIPIMSIGIGVGSIVTAIINLRSVVGSSVAMIVISLVMCIPFHSNVFIYFSILLFLLCVFGGMLSSALYSDLLKNTQNHTSALIATNNICNSLVMECLAISMFFLNHINPKIILLGSLLLCFPIFLYSKKPVQE